MASISRVCFVGSLPARFNDNSRLPTFATPFTKRTCLLQQNSNLVVNGGASSTTTTPTLSYPYLGRSNRSRANGNVLFASKPGVVKVEEDKNDASKVLSGMLPFIVAATAVAALANPATFTWVSKDMYAPALGGIMLSIGIRLSLDDFALVVRRPLPLSIGFIAQYVMKPALGVFIAKSFGLPPVFYTGFVLMSCVAGAQLSSYASFLSKGDVALSILLTSLTTISSAFITPLLTGLLIGSVVPVDAVAMSKSILQVVLFPVTLGLVLNTYAKPLVGIIRPVMPFVAMFCTSVCIGSPLAINRSQILSPEGLQLILPVFLFHTMAFAIGYWASKIPIFRQEEAVCRTVSLCTGMQSSTIAGLLASQFLGSSNAVPPACSVVTMAIMGLSIASFWGNGYRFGDILFPPTTSPVKA